MDNFGSALLLVGGVLAFLIIWRPRAGLTLALVCDAYLSATQAVAGYPPRSFVIALLCFPLLGVFIRRHFSALLPHPGARRLILIFGVFIILSILIDTLNNVPISSISRNTASRQLMSLCIGIMVPVWIKDGKSIIRFSAAVIIVITISACIGIMQFIGIDAFWELRFRLAPITVDPGIAEQLETRARIVGLALFAVPLSYQICLAIPLGLAWHNLTNSRFSRRLAQACIALCSIALLLTMMRSAIIGLVAGMLVCYRDQLKGVKIKALIAVGLLVGGVISSEELVERFTLSDSSALGRIPLALAGLSMALEYPFGVGMGNFIGKSGSMYQQYSNMLGAEFMFETTTHNQFINTLVAYGFFSLGLLLVFIRTLLKGIHSASLHKDRVVSTVSKFLEASFIAYLFNSTFHNAGFFYGDVFVWYFIGLSISILNRSAQIANL